MDLQGFECDLMAGRVEYAAQTRDWRAQAGMTLRQFAEAAGTSASRLSDCENAKVAPTTDGSAACDTPPPSTAGAQGPGRCSVTSGGESDSARPGAGGVI